ncbi:hypothetical protein RYH80_08240 [Halobaculum sp. MBLA0147]|uniref:hypothetical protein n=1 Tax=Halobaculum sp. MBLA0147 TaxID=3079934 RepID=UPI003523FAC7
MTADDTVEALARLVGTEPDPSAVRAELEAVKAGIVRATSQIDGGETPPPDADLGERVDYLAAAAETDRLVVTDDGDAASEASRSVGGGSAGGRSDTGAGRAGDADAAEPDRGATSADAAEGSDAVATAARRVAERRDGLSRDATRLLDALDGGSRETVEAALADAVDAFDAAGAVASLDASRESARRAVAGATTEAEALGDTPAATAVRDRLAELQSLAERVDETNRPLAYAVQTEATFYRETLIDALAATEGDEVAADDAYTRDDADDGPADTAADATPDTAADATPDTAADATPDTAADATPDTAAERATEEATGQPTADETTADETWSDGTDGAAADADTPVSERVTDVAERRREITELYVNRREDHNHSIPLLFLRTADTLRERAETAMTDGDATRAAATAEAAAELLDTVESLYERNEYSVMLRRLRG